MYVETLNVHVVYYVWALVLKFQYVCKKSEKIPGVTFLPHSVLCTDFSIHSRYIIIATEYKKYSGCIESRKDEEDWNEDDSDDGCNTVTEMMNRRCVILSPKNLPIFWYRTKYQYF